MTVVFAAEKEVDLCIQEDGEAEWKQLCIFEKYLNFVCLEDFRFCHWLFSSAFESVDVGPFGASLKLPI